MVANSNTFNAFLTTPASITQKALQAAVDIEERERKEEAQLTKDFYYGKQEQSIVLLNEDVDPVVVNLTKPIMDKRCGLLYVRPLKREFTGPAQSVAFVEAVYRENGIDQIFKQADLLSELTGSVLLHPYMDETSSTGYRIRIYDATQFSAVGNDGDPSTTDAISLVRVVDRVIDGSRLGQDSSIRSERTLDQQIWTKEAVVYYEGSTIANSQENELGFLPFVNIHGEEVHDEFIGYAPAVNIRKMNSYINQHVTNLSHMIKEAEINISLSVVYTNLSDDRIIENMRAGSETSTGPVSIGSTSLSGDSLADRNESTLFLAALAARYAAMGEEILASLDTSSIQLTPYDYLQRRPQFRMPFNGY